MGITRFGFGSLVWGSGKKRFSQHLYSIGRGSLLSDGFLSNLSRQCRKSKSIPLPQGSVLGVKDLFLSSMTIPRSSSDGDAPRWSIMESNDWNESRIVLNCLLRWIIVQTKGSLYTSRGRYGLVLHTCTVESADGWNAMTAVQRRICDFEILGLFQVQFQVRPLG